MSEASKTPETVEQHLAKWAQQPGAFITDAERHFIEYMRAARMRGVGFGWMQQVIEWEWQTVSDAAFGPERLTEALDRAQRAEDKLTNILSWCKAYPLSIFPEPDFAKARMLLEAGGMTLDAVSASNMRHVLKGVEALASSGQGATESPNSLEVKG